MELGRGTNVHMDIKADRQEKEYDIKLDETMVWGDIWREKVWGWDDLIQARQSKFKRERGSS